MITFVSRNILAPNFVTGFLVASEVYDRLQQAMASDPSGFCDLYRDFLADAWQTLAAIRAALAQQRANELRGKAHYLKSSSAVLGVRPLAQCCADLEEAGRTSSLEEVPALLAETTEVLNSVQAELERRLGPQVVPEAA